MSKIIAFSGKRGVGKTVASDYLRTKGFKKESFASSLKELSDRLWWDTEQENGCGLTAASKEKPFRSYPWTPREFMIDFGQFMRKYDRDYWLRPILDTVRHPGLWTIDDVRFPNEYDGLKTLGAVLVRINRKPELNIYGKDLDDPSETGLDFHLFDYTISTNENLTLKDLHNKLDDLFKL